MAEVAEAQRWTTPMDASDRQPWLRMVVLLGAVYFVFGIAFAAFARWSGPASMHEAADGTPKLDFLDEAGKVIYSLPEQIKTDKK